jgi:hypothetical protein
MSRATAQGVVEERHPDPPVPKLGLTTMFRM